MRGRGFLFLFLFYNSSMNTLKDIFHDHYEEIKYLLHPRKAVMSNIDRMLTCGDSQSGGAFFGCGECGSLKFVPYTCKSHFCPSCGNMYNQKCSFSISTLLISCIHHLCVFTIAEELRKYFLQDRSLMNKSENFTPGLVCVLHTFGRDLKWNPHIHALISERSAGNFTPWRVVKHFDYTFLRNSFRKVLLDCC